MSEPGGWPLRPKAINGDESAQPTAHAIALSELDTSRQPRSNGVCHPIAPETSALGELTNPLRHLKAKLTVCVGSAELTVTEFLDAAEGQVLRLDQSVEQPVDVLLEGRVVARGTLVAVDEYFAVRITELPSSLNASLASPRKP
jgi:flagellar motor switch protein FliN/FliY